MKSDLHFLRRINEALALQDNGDSDGEDNLHIISDESQEFLEAVKFADMAKCNTMLIINPKLINTRDVMGSTPLMIATTRGMTQMVKFLLNQPGCEINAENYEKETALSLAATHGETQVLRLLLAKGSDVNKQNADGNTPLILATRYGHTDIINLLLMHPDCNPNIQNQMNSNALMEAVLYNRALHNNLDAVNALLQTSAKKHIDAKDKTGSTALKLALMSLEVNKDLIRTLLSCGDNYDAQDEQLMLSNQIFTPQEVYESKANALFLGLHPRAGADSSLIRFSQHDLCERQLLWKILQCINPDQPSTQIGR